MPRIRIGINALYLIPGGVGGTEIYLRSLLEALGEIDSQNEYIVFTNRETAGIFCHHGLIFISRLSPLKHPTALHGSFGSRRDCRWL